MQKWFLKNKKLVTYLGGGFIVLSFILKNDRLLLLAALLLMMPILLQAIAAMRLKLISIELLVSIAVLAALLIQNYEESAIVSFLFLFGGILEQKTLERTRASIKDLLELAPKEARVWQDGKVVTKSVDTLTIGDIILVTTGDQIAVDGYIIEGDGNIDESMITGEPFTIFKTIDDYVYAGSFVDNGFIKVKATQVAEATTFAQIIQLVEEAQDSKSKTEVFIDQFARYYTPLVLLLSIFTLIFTKDISLTITILVLACPGALVIGVPISNVAGIGKAAQEGILFKGSETIKRMSAVDSVIFDKTGTLTKGKPIVNEIKIINQNVIPYIYSLEKESNHPLAQAIINKLGKQKHIDFDKIDVIKGKGIKGISERHTILVGNLQLMYENKIQTSESDSAFIEEMMNTGHTLVLASFDQKLAMMIGIKDEIRTGVKETIVNLKELGIQDFMVLSGDHQRTVDDLIKRVGIDQGYGNLLPEDKSDIIHSLQKQGKKIAFIGDGINDSPSLALADIGIAMGNGTDVAIETSDIVIVNDDFKKLSTAFKLSKKIQSNIYQNIFIAIMVVIFLIVQVIWSDWMNMGLGMLIHEGSILVVILNGMRLKKAKIK